MKYKVNNFCVTLHPILKESMLKKSLKYTLSLALAAILLWFSFRDVEWHKFMEDLKECNVGFILISMAAGIFAFWLRALRWRELLLPIDPNTKRITAFNGINIGNIANFAFPRIGEFVRCGVIVRRGRRSLDYARDDRGEARDDRGSALSGKGISYDQVLGTVVLERGWELLVMLLMLALVLVLGFERFGNFFIESIWTPMSAKMDLWWIIVIGCLFLTAAVAVVWKLRNRNTLCNKIAGIFLGIVKGFSSCFQMEKKWKFFLYTLLIWMTYWFMASCTVWAAPFLSHLDVVDALFLSLVGGLGFAVPVPGGIGAFHFIIGLTLSTVYGIPMETAIIYATISHTSQAITQIFCGATSYGFEALKK